jgi:hypothetical protein
MLIVLIVVIVAVVILVGVFHHLAEKKRREAFAALATRLGLSFSPDHDRDIPGRYGFLNRLAQGSNRYAYNVLAGVHREQPVLAFDYHYETHSTDSKGRRQTHHHHFSFFIAELPRSFAEVLIAPEGFFSKLAQAFGFDDIDFESAEFSRRYCVAYDVCNARMIEYLLANPDISLELEGAALAMGFSRRLEPAETERNVNRLLEMRERLPGYLFA